MSDAQLEHLERDVEEARVRVASDLTRLRAVDAAELKSEISAEVSGTARDAVRDRTDGVLSEIKARAAANPGATLALAAGLAWRLYRHPPIASLLVGAGLLGLMRTDPRHPAAGGEMARRAAGRTGAFAESAQETADEVAGAGQRAQRQAGRYAEAARGQLEEWQSQASHAAEEARAGAAQTAASARERGRRVLEGDSRDSYLVGAAALALTAALGIAAQRRLSDWR